MKKIFCLLMIFIFIMKCSGPKLTVQQDFDTLLENARDDPNNPVVYYNLGLHYLSKGQCDQALDYLYQCIERAPHFSPAYFAVYCAEYKNNKTLYRESLKEKPDKEYIEKIDSVQSYLERAFLYDPFFSWQVGTVLLEPKETSVNIYEQALIDLIYEYFLDGFRSFFLGDNETAIELLGNSIERYPDFYQAHFVRGLAYAQIGKYEKTIDDFLYVYRSLESIKEKKVLPIQLDTTDLLYLIGCAYAEKENYRAAQENFEQLLTEDMSFYMAHYQLSRIYQAQQKYDKALREINAAILLDSKNPVLCYNKAVLLSQSGHLEKSIRAFENAIGLNQYCYNAYFNLGLLYEYQQEIEKALECYQAFLKLAPKTEVKGIETVHKKLSALSRRGG